MYKQFDKELFAKYDEMGRSIVKDFVKTKEVRAVDNPDKYGIDLLLYKNDRLVGLAEVEVRNSWKGLTFPYEDLNVPQRKKKLLDNNILTYFFSINADGTAMFYCKAKEVLNSELKESGNKYIASGEHFYKVPIDKLKYVVL